MVEISSHSLDGEYTLILTGHAEYAKSNDIVCASVSAIIESFLCYLHNSENKITQCEVRQKSGDVFIHVCGNIEEAYRMTIIGLQCLAFTYPKNVKVK